MQVRLKRSRPYGYLLAGSETAAAMRLVGLGVTVLRVGRDAKVDGERYRITSLVESKKEDVRRNDDDNAASVVRIAAEIERAQLDVSAGDFYVPMNQPLANIIAAALEPETQSSYAANRILALPKLDAAAARISAGSRACTPIPLAVPSGCLRRSLNDASPELRRSAIGSPPSVRVAIIDTPRHHASPA